MESEQRQPKISKRGIRVEDDLWFALAGALRSEGTDITKWFKLTAHKFLAEKQQRSQGQDNTS